MTTREPDDGFRGIERSVSGRRLADLRVLTLVDPTAEDRARLTRRFLRKMSQMLMEGD